MCIRRRTVNVSRRSTEAGGRVRYESTGTARRRLVDVCSVVHGGLVASAPSPPSASHGGKRVTFTVVSSSTASRSLRVTTVVVTIESLLR